MAKNRPSIVQRPSVVRVRKSFATYRRTFAYNVFSCSQREITGWDFVVISVLWSFALIHPWVQKWEYVSMFEFASKEISISQVRENYICVLVFKCAATLVTACAVDLRNQKLMTYLFALIIYSMAPIFWILITFNKSAVLCFFPPWFISAYFVSAPVMFILIFNQTPDASASETRHIVAIFELATSLSTFILFMWVPAKGYPIHVLTIVWIGFLSLITIYILILAYVKRYVTNDVITEPTPESVMEGIRRQSIISADNDDEETVKRKVATAKKFTLFVLFLLPILAITSFDTALTLIDNTVNREGESSDSLYKFISKLVFIPAIALLFSGAKGHYARLGDIIVIGIAHAFNIVVICLIVVRFSKNDVVVDTRMYGLESRLKYRIAQSHPTENETTSAVGAVIHIYNCVKHVSVYLKTPFHESARAIINYFELPVSIEGDSKSFKLEVIPKVSGKTTLAQDISVQSGKHYWLLIIGERDDLSKLIQVWDAELILHTKPPVLVVLNGMIGETIDGVEYPVQQSEHYLEVIGPRSDKYLLKESNKALKIQLSVDSYVFIYLRKTGSSESRMNITLMLEPYGLYSLVIAVHNGLASMELQNFHLYADLPLEYNNKLPPIPSKPLTPSQPPASSVSSETSNTSASVPPLMLPTLLAPMSSQASMIPASSVPSSSDVPTSRSSSAPPTSEPLQISRSLASANGSVMTSASVFTGFTQAATTVGYIHYFWTESPLRLRTTILACFLVVNEVVAELTKTLIGDFGLKEACVFLVMNSLAGICHVTLGVIYHKRARREQALLEAVDVEPLDDNPSTSQRVPAS